MANKTKKKEQIQQEKYEAFVRLANARMDKILKDFQLLGNLTSKNYIHKQEDADKIIKRLRKEVDRLEDKFNQGEEDKFRL